MLVTARHSTARHHTAFPLCSLSLLALALEACLPTGPATNNGDAWFGQQDNGMMDILGPPDAGMLDIIPSTDLGLNDLQSQSDNGMIDIQTFPDNGMIDIQTLPDNGMIDIQTLPDNGMIDVQTLPDTGILDSAALDGAGADANTPVCPPLTTPGASASIGPTGGSLTSGLITLTIPAGALAATTTVTLTPTTVMLNATDFPITAVYAVGPEELALTKTAELTFALPLLPPDAGDLAVYFGPLVGPYVGQTTTTSGNKLTANVSGPGIAYVAHTTPPTAPSQSCTPKATQTALFSNAAMGGTYHTLYPRTVGGGFKVTADYLKDGLWSGLVLPYTTEGAATGTPLNLAPKNFGSLMGAHTAVDSAGQTIFTYENNTEGGSEIWLGRFGSDQALKDKAKRISLDTMYSQWPQVAVTPGDGACVVWVATDPNANKKWLRIMFFDSSLAPLQAMDLTPPDLGTAAGDFAVVSGPAGVGVAWSYSAAGGGGVRYQTFNAAGCPLTPQLDLATKLVQAPHLTAAARAGTVAIAYGSSGDSLRIRLLNMADGAIGAGRSLGAILSHVGIAGWDKGWAISGVSAAEVRLLTLDDELDPLLLPATIGAVSAIGTTTQVAILPDAKSALVTWTSTGSTGIGGPQQVEGRLRAVGCP